MSLWVTVSHIENGDRELILQSSGRKYDLVYKTEGQRIHIKSNMEDEGYAMYMFNLFKRDLGFVGSKKHKKDEGSSNIRNMVKEELKKMKIFIDTEQSILNSGVLRARIYHGKELISKDETVI